MWFVRWEKENLNFPKSTRTPTNSPNSTRKTITSTPKSPATPNPARPKLPRIPRQRLLPFEVNRLPFPVFPIQIFHPCKFPGVRRHQLESPADGLPCNQQVIRPDWPS